MEHQDVWNYVLGGCLAMIGWIGRTLWDAVAKLKDTVQAIEVGLPINYVRKSDLEARFDKIDLTLERLFDKLDNKADK